MDPDAMIAALIHLLEDQENVSITYQVISPGDELEAENGSA